MSNAPVIICENPRPWVSVICINRPEKRNALTSEAMTSLAEAITRSSEDPACTVILIRGRGGTFCSGRDLSAVPTEERSNTETAKRLAEAERLADVMLNCPKALIAAVEGFAIGVGLALALWCDYAIAEESAIFSVPELKFGIPPTMTAVTLLDRIGRGQAMEFILTGRRFTAAEAMTAGVVHSIASKNELGKRLDMMVGEFKALNGEALAVCKRLLRDTAGLSLGEGLKIAARTSEAFEHPEKVENLQCSKLQTPADKVGLS